MKNDVRNLRRDKGMTQEELGEMIGVSRQTINAIEKEKFDQSLNTAFKMSRVFQTTIEKFFFYEK